MPDESHVRKGTDIKTSLKVWSNINQIDNFEV